jgi:hypothetical protein
VIISFLDRYTVKQAERNTSMSEPLTDEGIGSQHLQ